MESPQNSLFRLLPSVHELLDRPEVQTLLQRHSRESVAEAARSVLGDLRDRIRSETVDGADLLRDVQSLDASVRAQLEDRMRPRLQRVINATGVILQTNLGRAPLSDRALEHIEEVSREYCNLEYDLDAGQRSKRDVHAEGLLLDLLRRRGAMPQVTAARQSEPKLAAAVVNNCAAATFLTLNTVAEGGEVIVSRGELVEIGGGFRVPEILAKSGATLREVGTTNKTRISDYASAVTPSTKMILRVHRSNFKIEGFTEQPSLAELVDLGRSASLPVFEDQGTGCVLDLATVGLAGESSWVGSVRAGSALVAASGDKLLGGPQCGLLVGEQRWMDLIRANPLFRALRVDKLTYAALGATLLAYLGGTEDEIPVLRMLRLSAETIQLRCDRVAEALQGAQISAGVVATRSVVGGGTTPGASVPSFAVSLLPHDGHEGALAAQLRRLPTPVVARVSEGRVLLDLRTVDPRSDETLIELLKTAVPGAGTEESLS